MIHPTLEQLVRLQFEAREFSLLPRQPVHSLLSGRHASRLRGRGLTFEELRDYRPGDDIRTMDWKATARLRKPHVRVYTEERERPVLLVVDQRVSMFFGSARTTKATTAAELVALSAWRTLDAGDRVGAIVFDDDETVDRLTAVKEVLGDFLVRRQGDRVALVVFGNSPFLQVPFGTDLELSRRLLEETDVGMAGPRTALGDAIGLGIELFKHSDAPAKTMIALTDGNDNASSVWLGIVPESLKRPNRLLPESVRRSRNSIAVIV